MKAAQVAGLLLLLVVLWLVLMPEPSIHICMEADLPEVCVIGIRLAAILMGGPLAVSLLATHNPPSTGSYDLPRR